MKTIAEYAIAVLGMVCLTFASCTKEETEKPYSSDYFWTGKYPVKTQNGTDGELEDRTGYIVLQFENDGAQCVVETGIEGLLAMNRITLEARWSASDSFGLFRTAADQSLLAYMGTITGESMALMACNCDGIAATYSLVRLPASLLIN